MANTYIHTLPDVLATDPNAYTILDYENQFEEYVTAKVTLASLANFTNNTFLNSTPYLNSLSATTYVENNSANIQGISNVVNSFSSNSINVNTFVNSNSSNIQSVYTHYNSQSANFATRNYVNGGFLPLSGGDVIGELFATQYGVGNTVIVDGTLGTVVRKMQIFDINGASIGFIPIYNSIT
jgi:hypothetical protein